MLGTEPRAVVVALAAALLMAAPLCAEWSLTETETAGNVNSHDGGPGFCGVKWGYLEANHGEGCDSDSGSCGYYSSVAWGANEQCPYDDAGWCHITSAASSKVVCRSEWIGEGDPDPGDLGFTLRLRYITRAHMTGSTASESGFTKASWSGRWRALIGGSAVTAPDGEQEHTDTCQPAPVTDSFPLADEREFTFLAQQGGESAESMDNKEDARARAFADYCWADFEISQ